MFRSFERRFRHGLLIFVMVCAAFAVILMPNGLAVEKASPEKGCSAPDFTLADLNGKNIELQGIIKVNKVTLVNFWGIWCTYCADEIPELVDFYSQYHRHRVEILAVNVGDSPETVPAYVKRNQMAFPVLIDNNYAVYNLYRVAGYPTTFIIDGQGKITDLIFGPINFKTLAAKTEAILKR